MAATVCRPTQLDVQTRTPGWREFTRHVIFDHDTPQSRAFDVALLALIAFSVLLVMLETVEQIEARYGTELLVLERRVGEPTFECSCARIPDRRVESRFERLFGFALGEFRSGWSSVSGAPSSRTA